MSLRSYATTLVLCLAGTAVVADNTCTNFNTSFPLNGNQNSGLKQTVSLGGLKLDAADGFRINLTNPADIAAIEVRVGAQIVCSSAATCEGASFTAGRDDTYSTTISVTRRAGSTVAVARTCEGPGFTSNPPVTDPGTSSSSSSGSSSATSSAVAATGGASAGAVAGAVGSALGARGGASNVQATQDAFFFAAPSASDGGVHNLWTAFRYSSFDGALDGDGAEITLGYDRALDNGIVLGALLSVGRYDLTIGATTFDTEAVTFGPYISGGITDRFGYTAYVTFAAPEYETGATRFGTDRVAGGVEIDTTYALGAFEANSFLALSGWREELPAAAPGGARDISRTMATLGTRIDFAPAARTRPYIMVGLDAIRLKDGAVTTESVSPRLGLGVAHDFAMGTFRADIDGGEVFDGARDVSVGFGFDMTF
ncbi:MAG: hypothetical protein ACU0CO_09070 [Shimia sp.]